LSTPWIVELITWCAIVVENLCIWRYFAHAPRRATVGPGQRASGSRASAWVVGQHGAGATTIASAVARRRCTSMRAPGWKSIGWTRRRGAAAIDAGGVLPVTCGTPVALVSHSAADRPRLGTQHAGTHGYPAPRAGPIPAAIAFGRRRRRSPSHSGFEQGVHARRSLAVVVARLESDHGDGAAANGRHGATPPPRHGRHRPARRADADHQTVGSTMTPDRWIRIVCP